MSTSVSYVFCSIGIILAAFWAVLYLISCRKYFDILKAVDEKKFPVKYILKPGFVVAEHLGDKTLKLISGLSALRGAKPMDSFESFCSASFGIALFIPSLSAGFSLAAVFGNVGLLFVLTFLGLFFVFYPFYVHHEEQKKLRQQYERDIPNVISKTVLLCEAGFSILEAWKTVSVSADGLLYTEMRNAADLINNGMTLERAMIVFADKCSIKEAKQFAGIIARQSKKGGEGMIEALRSLNSESWQNRLQRAILRGQAAAEAMMIPMFMIFFGIIFLIAVPLLTGMNT